MLVFQWLEVENCYVRLVDSPSCIDISRFSTDLGLNRPPHRNSFKNNMENYVGDK